MGVQERKLFLKILPPAEYTLAEFCVLRPKRGGNGGKAREGCLGSQAQIMSEQGGTLDSILIQIL